MKTIQQTYGDLVAQRVGVDSVEELLASSAMQQRRPAPANPFEVTIKDRERMINSQTY